MLNSKHGKIGTGAQAKIQFYRLPVRPQGGQGQIHSRMLTDLKLLADPLCLVRQLMSLIDLLTVTVKQILRGQLHMRLIHWNLQNLSTHT